ncbi:hypothetical protein A2714_03225 [Candidatus Woesebacteria bacterium RIFCSPHIGHO2_01_FULL_38_9]|uniref:Bacterial sugar transferase domain-containing protein n=1 Tax=Candidatus Woesebacteria bacterium RIFCSPHIGHO2_01_FULL_38_9 TaxID=1802492 RepID=A0A1F7Y1M5_9BACT|nr:MAG: hypothetical protein A2714_03225 [Candidatus Woesebacteria bacterium RIFCSPHIGHO2_01_FULL_38_9]
MRKKISVSFYHNSFAKNIVDLVFTFLGIILFIPAITIVATLIKLTSKGPILFKQKRVGQNGRIFEILKFRTMRVGAEKQKARFKHLNEADGPVFKIHDDPRYTPFGGFLAHTGLDELPQLINVLNGEMSLVGPRPLPIYEANKLSKVQRIRELVTPGLTSSWVIKGSHSITFREWMKLDREYVENASFAIDLNILSTTIKNVLAQVFTVKF